jgi:hypothetical protein
MAASKKTPALGATIAEVLRMPIDIAQDLQQTVVPDLQRQMSELPDIIRQNVRFNVDSFKELPQQFRQGMKRDGTSMPMLLTKAASPFPILTPKEMQDRMKEEHPDLKEGLPDQSSINKLVEQRAKEFAEQIAKLNQNQNK